MMLRDKDALSIAKAILENYNGYTAETLKLARAFITISSAQESEHYD